MQEESNIRPEKFRIEDLGNGKSAVSFFDNIKEEEVQEIESEETTIKYIYDIFKIEIRNRENLEQEIEDNYNTWLTLAKKQDYDKIAAEVRAKRNELLAETDSEMCLDRMGIEIPENITTTTLLSVVKSVFKGLGDSINGNMARYRQELRDITKQEGFPYNVIWPTKEEK